MYYDKLNSEEQVSYLIKPILEVLQAAGGQLERSEIRNRISELDEHIAEFEQKLYTSNKTGNQYKKFDFKFNFAIKELGYVGLISYVKYNPVITLTQEGANIDLSNFDVKTEVSDGLEGVYQKGEFITAYFPAERKAEFAKPNGVENIKLAEVYNTTENAGNILLKYMVHMKTQQSFARNEGDKEIVERIQQWFDRFESALQVLLDEKSIHLEYDYKNYNFKIRQEGREPFEFSELSDGYSSVIYIVSDLILRMDKNWLLDEEISQYNAQGIVLIDELETHLHIELQKKILPFLTKFFPNIQFIVTTHSPYILNSISNAKAYDLEKHVELENLAAFSSDELAEGYFEADEYSDTLKEELERYAQLCSGKKLTEEERAERAELKIKFKNLSTDLSGAAREKFEDIERRRETND